MNRGEIWWARTGRGRRPFLIISRQRVIPLLNKVLAVPATTIVRGVSSELLLDEDDGMPRECVLSFDNIEAIPKSRFIARICTLYGERLDEACHALAVTTGCRD